jgi:dihydroxyacetone kinase-like predicted kinase
VDGDVLRAWLDGAVPALDAARERIDAVNVFPVPDGDTGTNVLLTVRGAADAVGALDPAAPGAEVLRALGRGALLAARGNSGVILSRYLGGLAEAAGAPLPEALHRAADAARTAVHEPEDGTVLTVAARVAAAAGDAGGDDAAALEAGVTAGRADLAGICAAHPVLRSARVVDAGACALLVLLDALLAALRGGTGPVDVSWLAEHAGADPVAGAGADDRAFEVMAVLHAGDPDALDPVAVDALRAALAGAGDAVAVVGDGAVLTAHVHADDPVPVLAAVGAAGGRWTATVRALVGGPRPVVACTAHPELAASLALAGAVALVLPDGLPAAEARAAVVRAAQDALAPVHALPSAAAQGAGAEVVVLPGDRLPAGAADPAWVVPGGAEDELGVLAAVVGVAGAPAAPTALRAPAAPAATAAAADPGAAAAAAEQLLRAAPAGPRTLVVLLGRGATADDGLDLADRLASRHRDVRVVVAGPVPSGPAFRLAVASAGPAPTPQQPDTRAEARP